MTEMFLSDFIDFNPTVRLPKGTVASFVPMDSVIPWHRDVVAAESKPYTGGTKFLDGDVLLARITPSLENGKTSIYRAAESARTELAFGSTEFIVARGIEGISDTEYIYYLLRTDQIRSVAIASMTGSSGRQRVQLDTLESTLWDLPDLAEQQQIAATLGALDDKIESNHRAAKKLNQLADAIADRMLASEPTRSVPLSVLAHFNTRSLRKGQFDKIEYVDIKQTAHGFVKGTTIFDLPDAPSRARRLVQDGDVIYSTVRPNRHIFAPLYNPPKNLVVSTGFAVASPTALTGSSFLTYVFSDSTFAKYLASAAGGSAYPAVDVGVIEGYEAEIPQNVSALREYEESTIAMRRYAHEFREESRRLASLRDALLPELMSGRIRVRVTEVSG
ncbi:restriction endonuclease subunit S [Rothia aeria]|uniref:restriction endonuclease subunit S n=1 Tax=Rothia aeria TaxID=172042 RepID=UPI0009B89F68|nr:restriction endonuclease subunit S [Rothia aeria]